RFPGVNVSRRDTSPKGRLRNMLSEPLLCCWCNQISAYSRCGFGLNGLAETGKSPPWINGTDLASILAAVAAGLPPRPLVSERRVVPTAVLRIDPGWRGTGPLMTPTDRSQYVNTLAAEARALRARASHCWALMAVLSVDSRL